MIRRAFRVLVAGACLLSLLLCVAACVAWVGSFYMGVQARWPTGGGGSRFVTLSGGAVIVLSADGDATPPQDRGRLTWTRMPGYNRPPVDGLQARHAALGFRSGSGVLNIPAVEYRFVVVPLWAVAAALALPPAHGVWATRRRRARARRRKRGQCPACGYDLTGNVSGTCPECGAATPKGAE